MTTAPLRLLQDRVAVVTGSVGAGIGRSTALRLAQAGATVVLNYGTSGARSDRSADIVAMQDEITRLGARSIVVEADTRSEDSVSSLVTSALDAFGAIDILINNAGAPWLEQDFAEATAERWRDTLAAEVAGPASLIAAVLPVMRERRWGRIVNLVVDFETLDILIDKSYGGRLERYPYPFVMAKRGRLAISELLAHHEWRYGITVNSVLPGIIEDWPLEAAIAALDGDAQQSPLANPDDVARVITQLCSEQLRHVTGSRIVIPGNLYERIR